MMSSHQRKAAVFIQGRQAGLLRETDSGYAFSYDAEYLAAPEAVAASLTLPLKSGTYESGILFPFFDGLIPEGWLLNVVSRNWKLNMTDRFGLLLKSCRDCIGDVQIIELPDGNSDGAETDRENE